MQRIDAGSFTSGRDHAFITAASLSEPLVIEKGVGDSSRGSKFLEWDLLAQRKLLTSAKQQVCAAACCPLY